MFKRSTCWAALGIIVGGLSSACGKDVPATAGSTDATMVLGPRDVTTVQSQPISTGITITGSLNPAQTVNMKSQIAGQIERIAVNRGTPVRRGQLLAVIDARGARAQAASGAAALESAERDLRAADTLYKAGALSERDFVQAKVARDAARAQLTQAREALSRATVTSPINGVVSDKAVESGEAVQTATLLFTVVNTDSLELAGRVAPDEVSGVRIGQPVRLTVDAYSGRNITGHVARIEPVAETGTRQVAVYVHVPNSGHDLVAGLFATGRIVTGSQSTPGPVIPTTAVRTAGGESAAYVVASGTISRRVVTLGPADSDRGLVSVQSGLAPGEQVLVNAPESPPTGVRVRLMDDSPAAAPVPPADTIGRK